MSSTDRNVNAEALMTGSILIAIGSLFLIDRFTDLEFHDVVRTWWPMILILVGLPKLVRYETLWNGLWLVALGCWLQVIQLGLFGLTYRNAWPLLLIVIGGGMITRAIADTAVRGEERNDF